MSDLIAGFPEATTGADFAQGSARLDVDAALYPLDALYGAAYIFIDRAYVFLERPSEGRFRVTLAPKQGEADASSLRALAGGVFNELPSCASRREITPAHRAL